MQARHFLLPLSALLALCAFGLWQWFAPAPARAPGPRLAPGPDEGGTPANPKHPTDPALPAAEVLAPDAWNLGLAGNAPTVDNNPRQGQVWLRLIDDETDRPLVNTRCELWGVYATEDAPVASRAAFEAKVEGENFEGYGRRALPIRTDVTDANGCLKLSATPNGFDPGRLHVPATAALRREGTRKLLSGFDVDFPEGEVGFLYPVPAQCEPVTRAEDLATLILGLLQSAGLEPLDVRVRRCPVISGRVLDPQGKPLADATIFAFPSDVAPQSRTWAAFSNGMYRNLLAEREEAESPAEALALMIDGLEHQLRATMRDSAWLDYWLRTQHMVSGHARYDVCRTRTDAEGNYRLPTLCRGQWQVMAWRHDADLSRAQIDLQRDATQDFTLTPGAYGRLEVVVHHHQATSESPAFVILSLWQTGPTGARLPIRDSESSAFTRNTTDAATTRILIEKVPAGTLGLRARVEGQEELWATETASVSPGKTTRVDMTPGKTAFGELVPEVYFGGKIVDGATFMLVSAASGEIERWTARLSEGRPAGIELAAGSYRACFQGVAPISFSIAAQERLPVRVDLPGATVAFSITAELHGLMTPNEDDQRVWLQINATGTWTGSSHLNAIGDRMHEADPEFDVLLPGAAKTWNLPPGEYIYQIHNAYGLSLEGPLAVHAGAQAVSFGLDSLPGLGVIRIDLSGFTADEDPVLEWLPIESSGSLWYGSVDDEHSPSIAFPDDDHGAPSWYGAVTELRLDNRTVWLVTGHGRRLSVTCSWAATEFGKAITRAATAPGNLQFRPEDASPWGPLKITRAENDPAEYEVTAVHADFPPVPLHIGERSMRLGQWRCFIKRSHMPEDAEYEVVSLATVDLVISASDTTLDLSALMFLAPGTLRLTLQGRGAAGESLDPWWEAGEDVDFRSPILHRLDGALAGNPPGLILGKPDQYVPGTPARLGYEPILLAPGRYRLLPWFDAPARFARDFEIKPGQTVEVTLQGG